MYGIYAANIRSINRKGTSKGWPRRICGKCANARVFVIDYAKVADRINHESTGIRA
jgi:hypothetical protein